tara:strand:+ start:51 stop:815 length:765 start_codon:yes stop_codon:yes gene_type:complete
MRKVFWFAIIIGLIAGYFIYDNNQKLKKANKAKKICIEHFKTSDQECLDNFSGYTYYISEKNSEEKWPEYKKQVQLIEDKIEDLKKVKPNINLLDYSYTSANEITDFRSEQKLKDKKILIAGGDTEKSYFDGRCFSQGYYVCLRQQTLNDDGNTNIRTTEVIITNIDEFPQIKELIDKLDSYAFYYYKTVVYGVLEESGFLDKKIKADYIILEREVVSDETYRDSLFRGIYSIKRKEYREYMKNNFSEYKKVFN